MELLVNSKRFDLPPTPFAYGGEGEIYGLDAANVAKVYYPKDRTEALGWTVRRQKVLALCNSYENFAKRHTGRLIAFPEFPAYELAASFDNLVGFSMRRYEFPNVGKLMFRLDASSENPTDGRFSEVSGFSFDDRSAIAFVYDLFALIDQLHQSRVVLGDINPRNFLCDPATRKPVLLDVDAAQIGGFPCMSHSELYDDPKLLSGGKNLAGAFSFDSGTDVFALAAVCFHFLVGVLPHRVIVTPPKSEKQSKALGISSVKCLSLGRDSLAQHGVRYFPCPENDVIEQRVLKLKALDSRLYEFFEGVFAKDERENVLFSLPISDSRHPGNHFFVTSGMIEVIKTEKAKKQQRESILARQGQRQLDSGFMAIVSSLAAGRAGTATPKKKPETKRNDPAAFQLFLQHFDLKVGT